MTSQSTVIEITPEALKLILELREQETIPELHLGLRIAGVGVHGFIYETAFVRPEDIADADHREQHGDLPVAIDAGSVDDLKGSVLDLSSDQGAAGLVLRNPNPATPPMPDFGEIELSGPIADQVQQLLDGLINPAIAGHGGWVRLVAVEDDSVAHLEMGGGCQGCGLAAMTLRQGIETAIKDRIPAITEIVDVTDHTAGVNPYY